MNTPLTEDFEYKITTNKIYLGNHSPINKEDFEWYVWFAGRIENLEDIAQYWAQEPKCIIQADIENYIKRTKEVTEWDRILSGIQSITRS